MSCVMLLLAIDGLRVGQQSGRQREATLEVEAEVAPVRPPGWTSPLFKTRLPLSCYQDEDGMGKLKKWRRPAIPIGWDINVSAAMFAAVG